MTVRDLIIYLLTLPNRDAIIHVCPCRERSCVLELLTRNMLHDKSPVPLVYIIDEE